MRAPHLRILPLRHTIPISRHHDTPYQHHYTAPHHHSTLREVEAQIAAAAAEDAELTAAIRRRRDKFAAVRTAVAAFAAALAGGMDDDVAAGRGGGVAGEFGRAAAFCVRCALWVAGVCTGLSRRVGWRAAEEWSRLVASAL